jgi:hypothetical protein
MSDHTDVIPGKVTQKMLRVHGVTCSPHVLAAPKQSENNKCSTTDQEKILIHRLGMQINMKKAFHITQVSMLQ